MNAWQPIETAPKDRTTVLVSGQWAGEINGIKNEFGVYTAKYCGRSDYDGFRWEIEGTDAYAAWCKPTHWMPIPEPPK